MIKNIIKKYLQDSLNKLDITSNNITIQDPRSHQDIDYATNIAMILSNELKESPLNIANKIVEQLKLLDDNFFNQITIAKPGFINFKINPIRYSEKISLIIDKGEHFGRLNFSKKKKALVEFVSANPTGPLTIGHGRGAIIGEFASTILEWNGYDVEREYYFNNAGRQMKKLGESVYARYQENLNEIFNFPNDGYEGDYIYDIANDLIKKYSDKYLNTNNIEIMKDYAESAIFKNIKTTLKKLNIIFDNFFNEKKLYDNQEIHKIVDALKGKNLAYEKDGAVWFKATALGLNQDRVLIKSSGEPTYRLPDMAYHKDKFEREYDIIVDVFGADHLDAYPDVLSVCETLGYNTSKVKVLVHQFVTIQENGKPVKMSTRKANFISLNNLIDEVGADVVKYFFAMRGINTHLNFDLNLAKDESEQNPVFYIQYGYARAVNILNKAKNDNLFSLENFNHQLLNKDEEITLIKALLSFPELISKSLDTMEPQLMTNYLTDIASKFHHYYAKHKVISNDKEISIARVILVDAVRQVLFNGLNILNISSPEKM